MKWLVDPDTKRLKVREGYFKKTGDDYAEKYCTIKGYFAHADGDSYFHTLSEKEQQIIDDVVEFDEITGMTSAVVGLYCRLKSGKRVQVMLFKQNDEGNLITDFRINWNPLVV